MNKISIVFPIDFSSERENVQYRKTIDVLKKRNSLVCCYGISSIKSKGKDNKFNLSYHLPSIISKIYAIFLKIIHRPQHNSFLLRLLIFDYMAARKVSKDQSNIVLVDMMLPKTVEKCKKINKKVIIYTGNSYPGREYERINNEYDKFGIKNKYIYGDEIYRDRCLRSLELCDYFITITKVSSLTYKNAGYDMSKCVLIPKNGTDFSVHYTDIRDKEKAFICTAFHCFIKGTHRLLNAWRSSSIKNVKLYIIGALNEDMKEYVNKNGPFENVVFTGPLSRNEIKDFYKSKNAVGILMSLSEGAGRVIPELMSYGFPMIVSPDATCDLIVDNYNGYIIDVEKESELVYRLKWFSEEWNRVEELRENVYSSIRSHSMCDFSINLADTIIKL